MRRGAQKRRPHSPNGVCAGPLATSSAQPALVERASIRDSNMPWVWLAVTPAHGDPPVHSCKVCIGLPGGGGDARRWRTGCAAMAHRLCGDGAQAVLRQDGRWRRDCAAMAHRRARSHVQVARPRSHVQETALHVPVRRRVPWASGPRHALPLRAIACVLGRSPTIPLQ